jgi:hypothetical protein
MLRPRSHHAHAHARRLAALAALAALALAPTGCGDDGSSMPPDAGVDARLEGFDSPDDSCPGAAHCASAGDGVLHVGGGKRIFTPVITETFTDENMNGEYDPGEAYVDADGDGTFDAYWLFGGGRPANAVETDLEARAVAFKQGDTIAAIVYCDAIGLLAGDIDLIREDARLTALGVDHVIVGAIHGHDSVDTIGLWGPATLVSGYNPEYNARLREGAIGAVQDAVAALAPAHLVIAKTLVLNDPSDPNSRTDRWNQDIRDPKIFDPTLTIARFVRADSPTTTLATVVNWADHPEVSTFGDDNLKISSHFVHWLRVGLENGIPANTYTNPPNAEIPGLGGVTVYVQGALGGQVGSIRSTAPLDFAGVPMTDHSNGHLFERVLGTNLARRSLEILATSSETVSELPLSYRTAKFHALVQNVGFQAAFIIDLLAPHPLVGYDPEQPVGPGNEPWIPLRATYLQVGPFALITAPGELHPELWVGGYDGSWSWGWPMLNTSLPNAPNLADAPAGPYLRDVMLDNPGVEYPVLAGLAMDFIGYIVPAYNYVLHPSSPYIDEAEGEHYEETYSLGPLVEQHAQHPLLDLAAWRD